MAKRTFKMRVEAIVEVPIYGEAEIFQKMERQGDEDRLFDQISKHAKIIEVVKVLDSKEVSF